MPSLLRKQLAAGGVLAAAAVLATAIPAGALTVSGRAYVIYVNIPNAGIDNYYIDTGWIPETGGDVEVSATNLAVPNLVASDGLEAGSHGDHCGGHSTYTISNGVLLPGDPAEITFTSMSGRDHDRCCDEADAPEAAVIEGLTFAGQPITVTGEFDQTVYVAGVGTLTINGHGHHHPGGGDDDDNCGDGDDHWVTALHLALEGGGEVIAGSAYFHSHDHCCTVPARQSTWGGVKALYR